ncbi:MAG: hypothetical protein STSR0008_24170 [Ignavibacterium sp.]
MKRFTFLILTAFLINNCSYKSINYESGPDLIIESVSITVKPEEGKDQLGMPVRSGYKSLDILIIIKNIGTKIFNSSLFIASTNSQEDFQLNYLNSFDLVEPNPTMILPNETLAINLTKRVKLNSSSMKFQVNYYSDQEKVAKEINYFNNSYVANY